MHHDPNRLARYSEVDVTYVHLAAHDSAGSPIMLMLLDGTWRRAM